MSNDDSVYGRFLESMDNIERHRRAMEGEFRRLCAEPCMKPVKPGDRVLVAAGLLGRGFLWARVECEVVAVADTSIKVRFRPSFTGDTASEEWIHPTLVTDVLDGVEAAQ